MKENKFHRCGRLECTKKMHGEEAWEKFKAKMQKLMAEKNEASSDEEATKETAPEGMTFTCEDCKMTFVKGEQLLIHISTECTTNKDEEEMNNIQLEREETRELKTPVKIPLLPQNIKLEPTEQAESDQKPYRCTKCNKQFTYKKSSLKHEAHCVPIEIREKDEVKQPSPIQNLSSSKGGGPIVCKHCGKCFPYMSAYVKHERKHTDERPYPCKYCPRRFKETSNLYAHERKQHTEGKCFKCNMCEKTFTYKQSLVAHEKKCHHQTEM